MLPVGCVHHCHQLSLLCHNRSSLHHCALILLTGIAFAIGIAINVTTVDGSYLNFPMV